MKTLTENKFEAYLHFGGPFTSQQPSTRLTVGVECKEDLLPFQKRGLMFTNTGYGKKIPTYYKVLFENKWRRVYCCIYSNSGICYIIRNNKPFATVDIYVY
jgi:hypothetical protein